MASQSQTSQSRPDRLVGSELDRKANEVVHFFLIWEQRKIPAKRADINKYVLKEHKTSYSDVIKKASNKLEEVFGLKLVEIGEGPKKSYILVNMLDQNDTLELMQWRGASKRGFLMTVLSLIFMSGNQMMDGTLWNILKKLGIEKEKPHHVLGDVKKLLMHEFPRQMYLDVSRIPNCDPPQFKFGWGLRAQHETSKRKILEFVTKLYDKSEITVWKSQYQDMLNDETEEMQVD